MKNPTVWLLFLPILTAIPKLIGAHSTNEFIGENDPNSFRASRLLYSPRSRESRAHMSDMYSILRRLRENQQQQLRTADGKQNVAIIDQNHVERRKDEGTRRTQDKVPEEEQRSIKETCHALHLQKCGPLVIDGFATPGLTMERKCQIRENFLTCMIKMKRKACRYRNRLMELDEESMRQFRQQILSLLRSARGCVLGIEIPQ